MKISNVKLGLGHREGAAWLSWELGEHRFNVNVSAPGLNPTGMIYKRHRIEPRGGVDQARKLDPNAKANAKMLQEAQAFARAHELLAAAEAAERERIAERDARNERRMAFHMAEELGGESLDCLRLMVAQFGRDSDLATGAQRAALAEAERIIALADKGERQKFRLRCPDRDHFQDCYAATKRAALEQWAFCNMRPGDNGTFLPEEIEMEPGQ